MTVNKNWSVSGQGMSKEEGKDEKKTYCSLAMDTSLLLSVLYVLNSKSMNALDRAIVLAGLGWPTVPSARLKSTSPV